MPKKKSITIVPPKKQESRKLSSFAKYSGMAFQMGITIGVFVFAGIKLDQFFEFRFLFTLIFSLAGVVGALYYFIAMAIKES